MVIVTPGSVPADGASDPANQVLVAIAQAFAERQRGHASIAGATTPSGQAGSAISVVRASAVSGQVSTVDNADTTQGQITVMQAIAVQLAGGQAEQLRYFGCVLGESPTRCRRPPDSHGEHAANGAANQRGERR